MTISPSMENMSAGSSAAEQLPVPAAQLAADIVRSGVPNTVERRSAGYDGTMVNWRPRFVSKDRIGRDRETIVSRSIDLAENDPHVAGLIESMNTNTIGTGLRAQARIKADMVPLSAELIKPTQDAMEWEWKLWGRNCDVHGRKQIQDFMMLADRCMLIRGEYLILAVSSKNYSGRYFTKLLAVDPLRMKTPTDLLRSDRVIDGVEVDGQGRPVAVWVHNNPGKLYSLDSSNFKRIRIWRGHRRQVFHGFIEKDVDQYRGQVFFSPAMKFFRDLSDLLDAEVVTNIVTSAVALFISSPDPTAAASAAAGGVNGYTALNQSSTQQRNDIESVIPGAVLYGNPGQKPEILEHNRPGDNFVPFIDTVLRAAAACGGIPYEVASKKYSDMNYSSARAAMLDAWRVFGHRQDWLGRHFCSPCYRMVMEEAWLRGYLDLPDFYENIDGYTETRWIAPARGQIDPVKETQSNILKLKYNMTTQADIAAADGKDWENDIATVRKDEQQTEADCGLTYPDAKGAAKENAK